MGDRAEELLSAHVQHELSRLRGETLDALIDEHTAEIFRWLDDVKFNEVVTREQIVGVIERYVIQLQVSGAITELAGQMANVIFSSKSSVTTKIEDILPADAYEEFADKVLSLRDAQRELVRYLVRSSAFRVLASRMVTRSFVTLLFRGGDKGKAPAALENVLSTLGERVLPELERRAEAFIEWYVERRADRVTSDVEKHALEVLDTEWLHQVADEIWDAVSHKPLSEAASSFTAQDLEDFVVLCYEFWLKFRKTPYFHAVSTDVVDQLFVKYGDELLSAIVEDMGVTEKMVAHELRTFVGPVLEAARNTGFLEKRIRAVLEPFYRSPAAQAILGR